MNRRVLVVEDDSLQAESFTAVLNKNGYRAKSVLNGEAAISIMADEGFDLFVIDIYMPALDGLSLLKRIRKVPSTKPFPVVLITAAPRELLEQIKEEVESYQPVQTIQKPFKVEELLQTVDHLWHDCYGRAKDIALLEPEVVKQVIHTETTVTQETVSKVTPTDKGSET